MSLTNLTLTVAALAASNGLMSNIPLYIRVVGQRLAWASFLPGKEDEISMLLSLLQAAIGGRSPGERTEVAV